MTQLLRCLFVLWCLLAIVAGHRAGAQLAVTGVGGAFGGAAVATTNWNPSDKSANVTLSNSNLTATATISGYQAARAVANHSTGKYFYQFHVDTNPGGEVTIVGIGNASAALGSFVGANNNGVGYDPNGAIIWLNSVTTAVQSGTTGDTISIAVDLGNTLFWCRTNSGNWNNNMSADPASGTGGMNFSTAAAGPYYAMGSVNGNTTAVTANFGATSYSPAAPSGFGNW